MQDYNDTIAAISTGASSGGIAVIRISGNKAFEIIDVLFSGKDAPLSKSATHTVHYGHIMSMSGFGETTNGKRTDEQRNEGQSADEQRADGQRADGQRTVIDEVLVSVFRAPRTYTREDIVEISCHGGLLVTRKILDEVISCGARPAEPGEFTKRAFLNGRIDLTEAEAVADIISSENAFSLKNSEMTLSGVLSAKLRDFRSKLIYECGFIESALDDPEHFSLEGYPEKLAETVSEIRNGLLSISRTFDQGVILKDGIDTVITGKPNAGKSSVLNLLSRSDRAIVTDVPGTTRDFIEEQVVIGNITLKLIDSAGIRDTEDTVEKIGVERTLEKIDVSSLIIFVADGSVSMDADDEKIIEKISGKENVIVLLNKSDRENIVSEEVIRSKLPLAEIVVFSANTGYGVERLAEVLEKKYLSGNIDTHDDVFLTNSRHKAEIDAAVSSLSLVLKSIEDKMTEDFFTNDLIDAYSALGRILGKEVGDDLVEEIFSKFCIGK